jgi:hypothetical protein
VNARAEMLPFYAGTTFFNSLRTTFHQQFLTVWIASFNGSRRRFLLEEMRWG